MPPPRSALSRQLRRAWAGIVLAWCAAGPAAADDLAFFEQRIRPLLVEHCQECHGAKKQQGGLRLDSRGAWERGGDSGPALVPGRPEDSRLIQAVHWTDPDFQMPPKQRLTPVQVALLEDWIRRGAPAPADAPPADSGSSPLSRTNHWAYQPPQTLAPPPVQTAARPVTSTDAFILARLARAGLTSSPEADPETLCRRLYFALIGLPPTPGELDVFLQSAIHNPQSAIETLVDRLLASPQFGERWGRHWLDVVRFAESVTLRGFIFREAWRYRDYVVDAFNRDLPFNEFIREQIAGDLLGGDTVAERQRRLVATTFLALGNTNLEEQDKRQLDLDVVDEQLDVLGKAFLGQTLGCARCHDHKFDPIPARDYYALAGILAGTRLLQHANVSAWVERPLPLPEAEEAALREHESRVADLKSRVAELNAELKTLAAKAGGTVPVVAARDLPGIVVDDTAARAVGDWQPSQHTRPFIGDGYRHDGNAGKGAKTLTFQPALPAAGLYEVRLAYTPGDNRATAVPVTVFSADGEKLVMVNQRETPPVEGRFVTLGRFRFEQNDAGFVLVSNEGTTGHVIADAVQFLPVDAIVAEVSKAEPAADNPSTPAAPDRVTELRAKLQAAEARLKQLTETGPRRPMVMAPTDGPATDLPLYRRGSIHNPDEIVPRGVFTVAFQLPVAAMPAEASGRRELADWIACGDNPLTARVFVNRAWHWLFGAGLVRSPDNFGTTGDTPTHPELLDHLAREFMAHGWSVKRLVRELVLSRTFRQVSGPPPAGDPDNRLLAVFPRRRLDAEALRDAMLAVGGRLRLDFAGGPAFDLRRAADYGFTTDEPVRSVYLPVFRNALPEFHTAFDFADPSMVVGARNVSTVAPQALLLLNHPFVREQAGAAAERLLALDLPDSETRLVHAYRLALGRGPSARERELTLAQLAGEPDESTAWTVVFHALFASLDFRHVH